MFAPYTLALASDQISQPLITLSPEAVAVWEQSEHDLHGFIDTLETPKNMSKIE